MEWKDGKLELLEKTLKKVKGKVYQSLKFIRVYWVFEKFFNWNWLLKKKQLWEAASNLHRKTAVRDLRFLNKRMLFWFTKRFEA